MSFMARIVMFWFRMERKALAQRSSPMEIHIADYSAFTIQLHLYTMEESVLGQGGRNAYSVFISRN